MVVSQARGWISELVDNGSFREFGAQVRHRITDFGMADRRPPGDGVITGAGSVGGRAVMVFAQDSSALGGSLGEMHARKITRVQDQALRARCPVIGLIDSGGARIQEGVAALDGYGAVFSRNVRASGRVPQISVILGACAGGAVYSPALTDVVIIRQSDAYMFLTGPAVVRAVTFEDISPAELGGADVHSRRSGVTHLVGRDTADALRLAREVLGYLPSSCWSSPHTTPGLPPGPIPTVPENGRQVYDVRTVMKGLVDHDSFLELQERYGRNLVTGFARMDGLPVGVLANQPCALAGTLDSTAAEKGARFVRMCDAFGLALIVLVDTPGFLPGRAQEISGVIRRGAKLLHAFAAATVPRVTVVLRKAYGGAYIVMNSKALGADAVYAWPNAELGVMGAEGGVNIIHRRLLLERPELREELLKEYRERFLSADGSAQCLSVDEIIEPCRTRETLVAALRTLRGGQTAGFRHDNLPL